MAVRKFKTPPSRKFGDHSSPGRKVWIRLGVIVPRLAREAIPHLAGAAELVFGDKGMSIVAQLLAPGSNLLFLVFIITEVYNILRNCTILKTMFHSTVKSSNMFK